MRCNRTDPNSRDHLSVCPPLASKALQDVSPFLAALTALATVAIVTVATVTADLLRKRKRINLFGSEFQLWIYRWWLDYSRSDIGVCRGWCKCKNCLVTDVSVKQQKEELWNISRLHST